MPKETTAQKVPPGASAARVPRCAPLNQKLIPQDTAGIGDAERAWSLKWFHLLTPPTAPPPTGARPKRGGGGGEIPFSIVTHRTHTRIYTAALRGRGWGSHRGSPPGPLRASPRGWDALPPMRGGGGGLVGVYSLCWGGANKSSAEETLLSAPERF